MYSVHAQFCNNCDKYVALFDLQRDDVVVLTLYLIVIYCNIDSRRKMKISNVCFKNYITDIKLLEFLAVVLPANYILSSSYWINGK